MAASWRALNWSSPSFLETGNKKPQPKVIIWRQSAIKASVTRTLKTNAYSSDSRKVTAKPVVSLLVTKLASRLECQKLASFARQHWRFLNETSKILAYRTACQICAQQTYHQRTFGEVFTMWSYFKQARSGHCGPEDRFRRPKFNTGFGLRRRWTRTEPSPHIRFESGAQNREYIQQIETRAWRRPLARVGYGGSMKEQRTETVSYISLNSLFESWFNAGSKRAVQYLTHQKCHAIWTTTLPAVSLAGEGTPRKWTKETNLFSNFLQENRKHSVKGPGKELCLTTDKTLQTLRWRLLSLLVLPSSILICAARRESTQTVDWVTTRRELPAGGTGSTEATRSRAGPGPSGAEREPKPSRTEPKPSRADPSLPRSAPPASPSPPLAWRHACSCRPRDRRFPEHARPAWLVTMATHHPTCVTPYYAVATALPFRWGEKNK